MSSVIARRARPVGRVLSRLARAGACPPSSPPAASRMGLSPRLLAWLIAAALPPFVTPAAAQTMLAPVVVEAEAENTPPVSAWYEPERDNAATLYRVGEEGVALFGAPGATNPYTMISELPGAKVETLDAYGLANLQGGNKGLRVRGEVASHGANGTLEGLPMNGPGPGPGYLFLVDAENVAGVSLGQGPIPSDRFSLYNTAGSLDTRLLWPKEKFGGSASISYGSENFRRLFARVDSGRLADGTAFFVSASTTAADKWRGSGNAPDHRDTFAAGLDRSFGALDVRLFVAHSDMAQDNYRGLTYEQARNLSDYWDYDYAKSPGGTTNVQRANWQGYNRQAFETTAALAEIVYRFDDLTRLTVKPFYMKEKGWYLFGQPNGQVRKWLLDHDWYGVNTELQTRAADTDFKFGYAYVSMEPPGPPTQWKQYLPNNSGGLSFNSWSMLADVERRHDLHSVFASAEHRFDALKVKGGLRYVQDILPALDFHNTAGVGDVSYGDALDQSTGVNATRSVNSRRLDAWLPYLGVSYALSPAVELKAAVGRNFGTPSFDVWNSGPPTSMSSQQLWNEMELELADSLDIGARFDFGSGYLEPTLYYTKYSNKAVTFYDAALGASYTQNVAKAHQIGLQLAGGWQPMRSLSLFGSLNWGRSEFDEDIRSAASSVRQTKGQQLPDVPALTASLGAAWRYGPYTLSPVVHYTASRYANVERTEKVPGYSTTNVDLSWRGRSSWGGLTATLSVINLFDRRYIGYISANELTSPGGTTYYPGAPRTVVAKVGVEF